MRITGLVALAAQIAFVSGLGAPQVAAGEAGRLRPIGTGPDFPNYSREDEAKACLYGYGMENSSTLDCIARDEKMRVTMAKTWPSIDDAFKTDCMARLSKRGLNSYYYLDSCIRNLQHAAATPD